MTTPQPIRVFFSYSHQDDRHRIRLEKALKLLERQGLIDTWSDPDHDERLRRSWDDYFAG